MKIEIEGMLCDVDVEDGGHAMIGEIDHSDDEPDGFFVRLHSWDSTKRHDAFRQLIGRRLKVTVELLVDA